MKNLKTLLFLAFITYSNSNAQLIKTSESIIKDTKTNLLWQDTKDINIEKRTFIEAAKYCESLELDTYKNWRIPDFIELFSIVDTKLYNPTLSIEFKYVVSDNYWTSKTFGHGISGEAFVVNFLSGAFNRELMEDKFYTRCVKSLNN
jgi:hypothetical protein